MITRISRSMKEVSFSGLLLAGLAACSTATQAASYVMYRDAGCGCCLKWAEHVETSMPATVETVEHPDIIALKDQNGVPPNLRSCHTMVVGDYVIEGHVPAAAIDRLLREKPADVAGLAVPGMPVGSPGMEYRDMKQPYQVIAFGPKGQRVFENYN